MASKRLQIQGLNHHVLDEGTGPPVLLLHGFPASSYVWRHQVPALTAAGYRVVAPDLRGCGDTDRPDAVEAYALPLILGDLLALLDQLGIDRAQVVAHDWGAAVAWVLAALHPQRVS